MRQLPNGNQDVHGDHAVHDGAHGTRFPTIPFRRFHPDFLILNLDPGHPLNLSEFFHKVGFHIIRGLSDAGFPILEGSDGDSKFFFNLCLG